MEILNLVTWADALYQQLGIANTPNRVGLVAWGIAEGGHFQNNARYNVLNTTWNTPDAVSINSVGVKAYTSWEEGLAATVSTLRLSYYTHVMALLQTGDAYGLAVAVGASPWGTGNFSATVARAQATVAAYAPGAPTAPVNEPVNDPTTMEEEMPEVWNDGNALYLYDSGWLVHLGAADEGSDLTNPSSGQFTAKPLPYRLVHPDMVAAVNAAQLARVP